MPIPDVVLCSCNGSIARFGFGISIDFFVDQLSSFFLCSCNGSIARFGFGISIDFFVDQLSSYRFAT
jgi:hypothetical protein